MTVRELMEILSKLDGDKEVTIWNCEYDSRDPLNEVEDAHGGIVTLF
jgi:hypothetical protein